MLGRGHEAWSAWPTRLFFFSAATELGSFGRLRVGPDGRRQRAAIGRRSRSKDKSKSKHCVSAAMHPSFELAILNSRGKRNDEDDDGGDNDDGERCSMTTKGGSAHVSAQFLTCALTSSSLFYSWTSTCTLALRSCEARHTIDWEVPYGKSKWGGSVDTLEMGLF